MKKRALNRRDVLKLAAIAGAGTLASHPAPAGANEIKSSKKAVSKKRPLHIAIVGGGMAGTALAYRLSRAITYPVITMYEPGENSCWYQPGLTMLGTGIWSVADVSYLRDDYLPMHVTLKRNAVTEIDGSTRTVTDSGGNKMKYDHIIVATGLQLDFAAIRGLEGSVASLQPLEKVADWMNDPAVASVYYLHGAIRLPRQMEALVQKARKSDGKTKLQIRFAQPSIAFKSPAAAKSVLLRLTQALEEAGVRGRAEIVFASEDGRLSANDDYDRRYRKLLEKEGVVFKKEKLLSVDTAKRKAVFSVSGETAYDFLHIVPPMKAGAFLAKSGLLSKDGFVDVDDETLEHKVHAHIFAIGDVAGCAALKTAAAISSQIKTVTETIRRLDEGKKPTATYDGYGCDTLLCPENTTALYEAWDYGSRPLSPVISLAPLKCHAMYWYSSLYADKAYLMRGVLRGWA